MKYQIVYFSKSGNTRKLAQGLARILPAGQYRLVDLVQEEPDEDAEFYLVGFGVQRGACPFAVLDLLERLAGKKILLFATGGLAAFTEYHKKLEPLITAFLPDDCEYLGFHLSQGSISKAGYDYLQSCLTNADDQGAAKSLSRLYEYSQNHPDEKDIEEACRFVCERLNCNA